MKLAKNELVSTRRGLWPLAVALVVAGIVIVALVVSMG
jgi:lactobin A/cerein 7B family class IIb bacteriocin